MSDPNAPPEPPYSPQQPEQPVDPFAQPYGYPAAPISYQSAAVGPRRPASTIVLGIIGILYAAILTICTGIGLIMVGGSGWLLDFMRQSGMSPEEMAQLESQMRFGPIEITFSVLTILVGVLAWIGSIGSFMGKELGRKALIWFAVSYLVLGVLSFGVEAIRGFPSYEAQAQMQAQPGAPNVPAAAYIAMNTACAMIVAIYPICVLFFYTRGSVKQWFQQRSDPAAQGQVPGTYYQQ